MNSRFVKWFGIFLVTTTFIIIFFALFSQLTDICPLQRGYNQFDYFYDLFVEGILFSLIVFVLGFFVGRFYYKLGKDNKIQTKLIKTALILQLISVIVMLIVIILIFLSCYDGCDMSGEGIFFVTIGIPSLIIYCMGILLLIINWFKNRNKYS